MNPTTSLDSDVAEILLTEEEIAAKVRELGARIGEDYRDRRLTLVSVLPAERQAHSVQRKRPHLAQRGKHGDARAAGDHVVLGVNLEPQAGRRRGERLVEMLGLESHTGGRLGHDQRFGRSEP